METHSNPAQKRKKHLARLAIWTLLWLVSTALVVFGSELLWSGNPGITLIALGLNVILGIAMVLVNRRQIEASDELEKKIQLESMGLTLGLTLVVGLAYAMLDTTGWIAWDAEIGHLVFFMGICYLITTLLNNRRYR